MALRFKRKFNRKRFPARKFKRSRKNFRKRSSLPRYDGMVRVKMQAFKEINNTDGNGIAQMAVDWGDQVTAATDDILRIRDTAEWVRYRNLYRQFRV